MDLANDSKIKESCFPIDVPDNIEHTIRIMPNDQNTGGFYIALFRKIAETTERIIEEEKTEEEPQIAEPKTEEDIKKAIKKLK